MLFGNAEDALLSLTQDPADIALLMFSYRV